MKTQRCSFNPHTKQYFMTSIHKFSFNPTPRLNLKCYTHMEWNIFPLFKKIEIFSPWWQKCILVFGTSLSFYFFFNISHYLCYFTFPLFIRKMNLSLCFSFTSNFSQILFYFWILNLFHASFLQLIMQNIKNLDKYDDAYKQKLEEMRQDEKSTYELTSLSPSLRQSFPIISS